MGKMELCELPVFLTCAVLLSRDANYMIKNDKC